jgi:hypothetical protein
MSLDPCSFLYAIGVGLLLFAMLYFIRRLVNAFERSNEDKSKNTEKLGWDFDQMDRNFVRASLAAALLTLLICWFTNHDKEKYPEFKSGTPRRISAAGRDDEFPLETPPFFETPTSDLLPGDLHTGGGSVDFFNTSGGNLGDRAIAAGERKVLNALERLGDGGVRPDNIPLMSPAGPRRDNIPLMSPPEARRDNVPLISPTINVITPEDY